MNNSSKRFRNQPTSVLCGLEAVNLTIESFFAGFDTVETDNLNARLDGLVRDGIAESGLECRNTLETLPQLVVGVESRPITDTNGARIFWGYRVEILLREWLTHSRSPTRSTLADVWRERSTFNTLSGLSTKNRVSDAISQEISRQVKSFRNAVLLSGVLNRTETSAQRLPRIELLFDHYPKGTVNEVADLIGGRVGANIKDPDQPEYKNTCAIRVSRALNYANVEIDRSISGVRTNSGGDRKWYVYGVRDLKRYLVEKYGRPLSKPKNATAQDLGGTQGIIAFGDFHIDLWNDDTVAGSSFFGDPRVNDRILLWVTP